MNFQYSFIFYIDNVRRKIQYPRCDRIITFAKIFSGGGLG
jgi:hypothetical protein